MFSEIGVSQFFNSNVSLKIISTEIGDKIWLMYVTMPGFIDREIINIHFKIINRNTQVL